MIGAGAGAGAAQKWHDSASLLFTLFRDITMILILFLADYDAPKVF